jgi:hypothetical protein
VHTVFPFPDVQELIKRLRNIGTVHIFDSPIYANGKSAEAKARSAAYFQSMGFPGMEKYYYHHEKKDFEGLGAEFMYDPSEPYWRFVRLFINSSPFPWIRIRK